LFQRFAPQLLLQLLTVDHAVDAAACQLIMQMTLLSQLLMQMMLLTVQLLMQMTLLVSVVDADDAAHWIHSTLH